MTVLAQDGIQFFKEPEMDYWNKPGIKTQSQNQSTRPSSTQDNHTKNKEASSARDSSFPWKKYLDPKNDEFFREGEYLPPAPFMEIARDPSDENIDHWFKYLEAKNEITRRLQARLSEYSAKHPLGALTSDAPIAISEKTIKLPSIRADAKRFRLRLYFDSKCPHCEHMIETLKALSQRGYSIELKQLDSDTQARSRIPFPVSGATPSELKQYKIESVPVLLVGDLKARTYFKIQGYQPEDSVLRTFTEVSSKQEGVSL